ncbi:hypothetical protein BCM02_106209 [Paenibacillus methanolicus]|uniref:Uncharacterized protein n=2 Tax=Paenibacillus methanolicus TaxID=582686 RepID=A0A5S5C6H4_9BACL|nr:hypothetical protein BCM02_106209 [Paenibacillus methanolicus]
MLLLDFRDGRREGPRPTRIKAAYVILLAITLYHAALTFRWLHLPGFYDLAAALFGRIGLAVIQSLGWKG